MPRETQIQIRVSFEEKRALEEKAERDNMPLTEWLRRLGLSDGAKVEKRREARP